MQSTKMIFALTILSCFCCITCGDVGILYEVWHALPADAVRKVISKGGIPLTTESVIRSNGKYTLDDVYAKYGLSSDIWNVQPRDNGFYCIYRRRPSDPQPPIEDCPNITGTLTNHAKVLNQGGIDYVAVDVTNWPTTAGLSDVQVVRPTEVLFEEWAALRRKGIPTPQISVWPCSPASTSIFRENSTAVPTWKYMLDTLYNNATYTDLIYRINGKKVVFLPHNPTCYDQQVESEIQQNGGRNDVVTIKMWALFGNPDYSQGVWGFFTPCSAPNGAYTSSIVGAGPCNQQITKGDFPEVSASGSYMLSQSGLPFAAPGHLRGLTLQRLFQEVLSARAPHLFLSSFNEHIGGRQDPASGSNIAFNMGLPNDSQRFQIWVDTYASEFSRDIEPTVEGGSRVWEVAVSCVQLYKSGHTCADSPNSACCTTSDKEVFKNIWSLMAPGGGDYLLTSDENEKNVLKNSGWTELCAPVYNPHVFCVDPNARDGRAGPFIIYSVELPNTRTLYRCITSTVQHFFSTDPNCEGNHLESILGYISTSRGGETLRALHRCLGPQTGTHIHALDLDCDKQDAGILGYVR